MEADKPARALGLQILDLHFQRRANACEAISEGGNQHPVAQVANVLSRDGVDQPPPLIAFQHGSFAGLYHVLWAADGRCRVRGHHLAGHQPVEQHPYGCELLLHIRRRMGLLAALYICRNIKRPHSRKRPAALVAPGEKLRAGAHVSPARVRVADVGGEEVDIAPGGVVASVSDERRN